MADEADPVREMELASLLAAHDDQLATGAAALESNGGAAPALDQRWREDAELLRLLDRLRPRAVEENESEAGEDRYELLRLHASGGMGRVWVARDADLGRDVALKELQPERAVDPGLTARFIHEARVTGRLEHPGIVPIYELAPGTAEEPPFYTMRLLRGQTLTEAARAYHQQQHQGQAERVDFQRLLHAFLSVCNTIAYAHTRGVIHRDLKGQNVLLGDFGEVIVIDWGFAKDLSAASGVASALREDATPEDAPPEDALRVLTQPRSPEVGASSEQTQAGAILGTPAYMAPEQAEGRLSCLDARTDVFGLGAMLYEILTGQPPFVGADTAEVLGKARSGVAQPPRLLVPSVPPALAAICARAMAHQPDQRYPSAAELARDLQHWLADEPVQAYRESWPARCSRWMRRHRTATAVILAALFTVSLLSGVGLAVISEARARAAQARARVEADLSAHRATLDDEGRRRLEEQIYLHTLTLAERELAANNPVQAEELLGRCSPDALRGWEWFYLKRRCYEDLLALVGHQDAVSAVAFHPDGRRLASAGNDQTIKVWEAASGRLCLTLRGHSDIVYDVAFSPDGRLLASAAWDGAVRLWDAETGHALHCFGDHGGKVYRLAFHPNGRHLAVLSDAGLAIRDVAAGTIAARFGLDPGQLGYRIAYHPSGVFLALTSSAGIYLLDGENGRLLRRLAMPSKYLKCLAFSPDGRMFATGEGDLAYGHPGLVRLWNTDNGALLFTFPGHTEPISALAFNPDGTRLFSASQDKSVRVWDVSHRQEALTLRVHTDAVNGLALSPDGRLLATAGADGVLYLWNAAPHALGRSPDELHRFNGHRAAVFAAVFTPDGQRILSLSHRGGVKLWEVASGRVAAEYGAGDGEGFSLAVSPDGRCAAIARSNGSIYLYETATGRLLRRLLGHQPGPIKSVAFSPDGQCLASAGWDRTVRIWQIAEGEARVFRGHRGAVLGVAFSPDGRRLASAGYDKTVRLWDAANGECLQTLPGHTSRVHSVAFSHSGRLLASAGNDCVRLWSMEDGKLRAELRGHTSGVSAAVFSPDDRLLASAGYDRTVRLWDVAAAREVRILRGHGDCIRSIAFSPDGRRLCSASHDRTVRIWQVNLP